MNDQPIKGEINHSAEPSPNEHSEFHAILSRAKQGDESAFEELYRLTEKYLLLIANQQLSSQMLQKFGASDVVQQSMLVANNLVREFRGDTKPQYLAWIREILIRECRGTSRLYTGTQKRDANREQTISNQSTVYNPIQLHDPNLTPSTMAASEEQVQLVKVAMEQLGSLERRVIQMRNWDDKSFEEIGEAVGKSKEASRKIWSRAVLKLEKELQKLGAI